MINQIQLHLMYLKASPQWKAIYKYFRGLFRWAYHFLMEPFGHNVKLNFNKRGDKIYHLIRDPFYDVTRIDFFEGENYTWNSQEAERMGFRRALNIPGKASAVASNKKYLIQSLKHLFKSGKKSSMTQTDASKEPWSGAQRKLQGLPSDGFKEQKGIPPTHTKAFIAQALNQTSTPKSDEDSSSTEPSA